MAKGKSNGGVQNRAIYSRVSFLQQAAVFLALSRSPSPLPPQPPSVSPRHSSTGSAPASLIDSVSVPGPSFSLHGVSRRLATDLRSMSLKTRIRLSPALKQTICKFCDSILVEGETCTSSIENKSKGGNKPWADVLVRKCHTCGRERRYPVHAARQRRKGERDVADIDSPPQKQQQQ
ncbi:RNAse P Rpr2/Rpp21/SNM1 subunit domain-containing protein, partial [Lasiosphaeria miniovina]